MHPIRHTLRASLLATLLVASGEGYAQNTPAVEAGPLPPARSEFDSRASSSRCASPPASAGSS
jgi:hypothetical protein